MSENIVKAGVAVIVKNSNKILLGIRLVKVGYGQWGLPGGHLEYGESLMAAAKRELLEETGLIADNLKFINVTNDPRDDAHYIHFLFLAESVHGQPAVTEPDKCEKWEWFDSHNLPEPIFYGHQKLLDAFLNNQIFND
jgi:8-oxo-dGTP diphosphatase